MQDYDAIVIGSGTGSLTTACLLASDGLRVAVLEQNWLPGGCTSSYWRKGFVFESGATTLVGLDPHMPLRYLLERTGIRIEARQLELPMMVHLADGTTLRRYQDLEAWIKEAERVFGGRQRPFWEFCYRVSQFVWQTSLSQRNFPPTRLTDLLEAALNVNPTQLRYAGYAFYSTAWLLRKYGLHTNKRFVDFVNEQLLITAQNHMHEVNVLFGATALCYTNYGNYYINGGLINLVKPLTDYLEQKGSAVLLRHNVTQIAQTHEGRYKVICTFKGGKAPLELQSRFLISGIPINNTLDLWASKPDLSQKIKPRIMESPQLNSAFQMGIGFKPHRGYESIHHQIHLPEPLPATGSASIFLSLSHPDDHSRSDQPGLMVASVSTHVANPAQNAHFDKELPEKAIVKQLEALDFLKAENIVYQHSSTPAAWQKWTARAYGFVGGYPQYMRIKPWQMLDARLDGHAAYLCGDTTYPGQGIPGAALSGIIAWHKLKKDHF